MVLLDMWYQSAAWTISYNSTLKNWTVSSPLVTGRVSDSKVIQDRGLTSIQELSAGRHGLVRYVVAYSYDSTVLEYGAFNMKGGAFPNCSHCYGSISMDVCADHSDVVSADPTEVGTPATEELAGSSCPHWDTYNINEVETNTFSVQGDKWYVVRTLAPTVILKSGVLSDIPIAKGWTSVDNVVAYVSGYFNSTRWSVVILIKGNQWVSFSPEFYHNPTHQYKGTLPPHFVFDSMTAVEVGAPVFASELNVYLWPVRWIGAPVFASELNVYLWPV